jgi:regulator of sigma D
METNETIAPPIGVATKRCSKCGQEKPITDFYASKYSKSGVYSYCKFCATEYGKKRYRKANGNAKTTRQLIQELADRGYSGHLKTQIVKPWEKLSEALQSALKNEGLQGATVVLDKDIDITNFQQ